MRVLSIFKERSLPLMRRVLAPFSVLHTRGYTFSFLQVESFSPEAGNSHDVTVLSNWVLEDNEQETLRHAIEGTRQTFVYDLSSPSLLKERRVQQTMALCQMVTVPNEYLAKEVKVVVPQRRVQILPSVVDVPYFMSANAANVQSGMSKRVRQETILGCFGDFDWHLCTDALRTAMHTAREGKLYIIGDAGAKAVLGDLVQEVEVTLDAYPRLLKSCTFGLMPMARTTGRDLIVQQEYGILSVPTLKGTTVNQWNESLAGWLSTPPRNGASLFFEANEYRATVLAQQYRHVYEHKLHILPKGLYTQG